MSSFSRVPLTALATALSLALPLSAGAAPTFLGTSVIYRTASAFDQGPGIGDFNHDGRLDLALGSYVFASQLEQAGGFGDGTLFPFTQVPATATGYPAVADFNGDGIPDVAQAQNGLVVRFGAVGTGLGAEHLLSAPNEPFMNQVVVGDVNGDGRLDLVTGHLETVTTVLGTGPGTFGSEITSAITPPGLGTYLEAGAAGDFDEDGKLDLLIAAYDNANPQGGLRWMKGNGDGTFQPAIVLPVSDAYRTFAVDLNGDGHLDAAGQEGWLPGLGNGTFGAEVPFPYYVEGIHDVTGDGLLDLVAYAPSTDPSRANTRLLVLRGDGAGHFTQTWATPILDFNDVGFGDFDKDGTTDLVSVGQAIALVAVYHGNGDGTFGDERHFEVGNKPTGVALADLDGDGNLDAITSSRAEGSITVLHGLANGTFAGRTDYPVSPAGLTGMVIGDLDGDGFQDVVTAGGSSVYVLRGNGSGLVPVATYPAGLGPVALGLADVNRDGHPDVVAAGGSSLAVLRNDGAGGLLAPQLYAAPSSSNALAISDLNHDSWPDVVVGNSQVSVFLGDGAGGLTLKTTFANSLNTPRTLAAGDADGDGIPDLVTVGKNSAALRHGAGDGTFPTSASLRFFTLPRALSIMDFDGDGKNDIIEASDWGDGIYVGFGTGGGNFTTPTGYGAGEGPTAFALGDLNHDGAVDAVLADTDTNLVSVLLAPNPGAVPALATLVSAQATASGAHIEWLTGGGWRASVERSENGAPWMQVGQILADGTGRLVFEDPNVTRGTEYAYRLGFDQGGRTVYAGLVSLHVPVTTSLALAASPNPAVGAFGVAFTLPDARPARLELYDVAGRRVLSREVGALGAGAHVLRLDETSRLASGLYWLRLVHPQQTLVARAAIVR